MRELIALVLLGLLIAAFVSGILIYRRRRRLDREYRRGHRDYSRHKRPRGLLG